MADFGLIMSSRERSLEFDGARTIAYALRALNVYLPAVMVDAGEALNDLVRPAVLASSGSGHLVVLQRALDRSAASPTDVEHPTTTNAMSRHGGRTSRHPHSSASGVARQSSAVIGSAVRSGPPTSTVTAAAPPVARSDGEPEYGTGRSLVSASPAPPVLDRSDLIRMAGVDRTPPQSGRRGEGAPRRSSDPSPMTADDTRSRHQAPELNGSYPSVGVRSTAARQSTSIERSDEPLFGRVAAPRVNGVPARSSAAPPPKAGGQGLAALVDSWSAEGSGRADGVANSASLSAPVVSASQLHSGSAAGVQPVGPTGPSDPTSVHRPQAGGVFAPAVGHAPFNTEPEVLLPSDRFGPTELDTETMLLELLTRALRTEARRYGIDPDGGALS